MKNLKLILFASILMVNVAWTGYAADSAPADAHGMDPAAMEKVKALMAPGEAHKILEAFNGKWKYEGKFWMAPDAPPQEMKGTSTNNLVYNGRFLKQDIEGPWMGERFEGIGYLGYDNIKKQYVSVWIDNMGTGIMTASGSYDPDGRKIILSGKNSCPLTGEPDRDGRSEWKVVDSNTSLYTSYLKTPEGKEFKAMELTYTRA